MEDLTYVTGNYGKYIWYNVNKIICYKHDKDNYINKYY